MSVLEPGKYIGTVEDFGIGTSAEKKTPFLNVKFRIVETGLNVYWQAYLTANTIERVTDTLTETGLFNTKKFTDLAKGAAGGGLKLTQEVELVVINEEYTDAQGAVKTAAKVQFVNIVGGGSLRGLLPTDEAIAALASLNLDAEMLASQQRTGVDIEVESETTTQAEMTDSDVPF